MEAYRIENLTFSYPNRSKPALDSINLNIESGAFVILCGPSGCGKTTLLRHLKSQTTPHGITSGTVYFEGAPLKQLSPNDAAGKIGFVLQSPDNQIVTDKVWHELAFGLESLGKDNAEIRLRVAEMASFFGIQTWFYKSVTELSGGQKQLLALASIMAMQPSVLILDEPTSQLDPIGTGDFLGTIGKINRELGVTVILTEHRLEEAFPLSTHAIVMDQGKIIAYDSPKNIALSLLEKDDGMFFAMPAPMRIWAACTDDSANTQSSKSNHCPITVREGADWLSSQATLNSAPLNISSPSSFPPQESAIAIHLNNVWFKYEKTLPDVIKGLNYKAEYGEISAILGGNGTGKTTALSLITGLNTPYRGKVHTDTTAYALPQNPQSLFVEKTVRDDLQEMLGELKLPKDENIQRIAKVVKLCRLDSILDSHPYDLSGGEQQRAALAKVLLLEPKILLLDEPTKGLDAEYKQIFAAILRKLADKGTAVILVSHDVEFCAEHADRCALFFDGNIVTENSPQAFFSGNSFYTTSTNRMARHILPNAVVVKDVVQALGGRDQLPQIAEIADGSDTANSPPIADETAILNESALLKEPPANNNPPIKPTTLNKNKLSKRTIVAAVMILLTIPLTLYIGVSFLDDRRFYFISMLIIFQTMLPFALIFERRKPQARELVIIAVLCAIAVAGRAAFFMLPQFKPVIAMVIIAGVAFGGETGFLVGAMTGLVSNMFFGQGPWTPWQMFAFGIIGFLSGILFRKGLLSRRPLPLSIFGGLATFFIFGGIMNPASVIMFQPSPTIEMFMLSYMYGIPFDLIHAAATVTFLALISRPMLEKLDRIKVKYGLVEDESTVPQTNPSSD